MEIKLEGPHQELVYKTYDYEELILKFCTELRNINDSRQLSIAVTHFETAFMFLRKAITSEFLEGMYGKEEKH